MEEPKEGAALEPDIDPIPAPELERITTVVCEAFFAACQGRSASAYFWLLMGYQQLLYHPHPWEPWRSDLLNLWERALVEFEGEYGIAPETEPRGEATATSKPGQPGWSPSEEVWIRAERTRQWSQHLCLQALRARRRSQEIRQRLKELPARARSPKRRERE